MYVHCTYLRESIYPFGLVWVLVWFWFWFWFWFRFKPYTKTKPNQNQTKTIPQKSTGFWFGFGSFLKPNQHQKRTKNLWKWLQQLRTIVYRVYANGKERIHGCGNMHKKLGVVPKDYTCNKHTQSDLHWSIVINTFQNYTLSNRYDSMLQC